MDMKGKIIEKYLPVSKIIPLTEESSVFIPYKGDLLIRETLRSDIFKIDSTGNAHTFISFDFGRYNVPRSYFENNDPVAAATKLMQSDIAIMDRFFVNDDYMVLSVDFRWQMIAMLHSAVWVFVIGISGNGCDRNTGVLCLCFIQRQKL